MQFDCNWSNLIDPIPELHMWTIIIKIYNPSTICNVGNNFALPSAWSVIHIKCLIRRRVYLKCKVYNLPDSHRYVQHGSYPLPHPTSNMTYPTNFHLDRTGLRNRTFLSDGNVSDIEISFPLSGQWFVAGYISTPTRFSTVKHVSTRIRFAYQCICAGVL